MEEVSQKDEWTEEEDFNLKRFFFRYARYWYFYAIGLLLAVGGAYFYNWYVKPVYKVYTRILIKDDNAPGIGTKELLKDLDVYNSSKNIDNEIEILRSRKIIKKTLQELDFQVLYYLIGDIKKSQMYTMAPFKVKFDSLNYYAYNNDFHIDILDPDNFKLSFTVQQTGEEYEKVAKFGEELILPVGIFHLEKREHFNPSEFSNPNFDKRNYRIRFNNIQNLTDFYRAKLQIEKARNESSIVTLAVEEVVPQRGIDFLNTLVKVYLRYDIEEKNKIASSTASFIQDQLEQISLQLEDIESERETYKTKRGIIDMSTESKLILENVRKLDNDISNYNLKISFINYLENYVRENKEMGDLAPSSLGIEDPLLVELIKKLSELESRKQKLEYETTPNNPTFESVNQQIQDTRKRLLENIESIRDGLLAAKQESKKELNQLERKIKTIPRRERELVGIERKYRIKESLYVYLLEKKAETSIALAASVSDNRIIDKARSTPYPIRPVPTKNYAIAILLAFLLPTAIIFIKEQLDDSVNDPNALGKLTKIPLLGVIGYNSDLSNLIVLEKPKSLISEAFRSIRTNLKYFASEKEQRVVLISSSIGSEGKTFTAMNMASIMALSGQKTVLIGMDLRKPRIVEDFGISNDKGISSYLIGSEGLDDVIIPSGKDENLDIIPSGPIPPNPAELIMTRKMSDLIEELKKRYEYIIIDSPPIGLVTDGLLLNRYADTMVFVVRQDVTKKQHINHLNQLYKDGKIQNATILFNAVKSKGFGYGYGYGYYEDKNPKKSFWDKLKRK